jgi:hypothetical protein
MITFLTTAQAAALLNITPNHLRQLVYRKKISQVYPGLFDPDALEQYKLSHSSKRGRKPKESTK